MFILISETLLHLDSPFIFFFFLLIWGGKKVMMREFKQTSLKIQRN